jgi:hypothetical protein
MNGTATSTASEAAYPIEPPRAPVFMVGSERSGTTLLRLMLDHHPEIAFEKEFDFVVSAVSDTGAFPPVGAFVDLIGTVRGADYTIDRSLGYRDLVTDFLRQKQLSSGGKRHVGATVHRHFHRLRFLWPDARYIHVIRDPRDVARSVVQKGWAGNAYQAAEFWIRAETCWDALVPLLSNSQAIEVHYEDLVRCTRNQLSEICRFIGVEFSSEMLEYPKDARQYPPPDPTLAGQWTKKMSRRDVAMVEHRTARLMQSRGYALSGYPIPTIGPVRHQFIVSTARLRRLRTRAATFGFRLVAADLLARQLGIRALAKHTRQRITAIEQQMIDQEVAGERAPSANIAPAGRAGEARSDGHP